jgi:hypothetical protein
MRRLSASRCSGARAGSRPCVARSVSERVCGEDAERELQNRRDELGGAGDVQLAVDAVPASASRLGRNANLRGRILALLPLRDPQNLGPFGWGQLGVLRDLDDDLGKQFDVELGHRALQSAPGFSCRCHAAHESDVRNQRWEEAGQGLGGPPVHVRRRRASSLAEGAKRGRRATARTEQPH